MRRLFLYILLPFIVISCSKTVEIENTEKPMVPVKLSIATDNGETSKAGGDGFIPQGYQLRYILEFYEGNKEVPMLREVRFSDIANNAETAIESFEFQDVRLVKDSEYTVVCWADYIKPGQVEFYDATSLRAVSMRKANIQLPNDSQDAYCGAFLFTLTMSEEGVPLYNGEENLSVKLSRPLAKVVFSDIVFYETTISAEPTAQTDNVAVYMQGEKLYKFDAKKGEIYTVVDENTGEELLDETGIYFHLDNAPGTHNLYDYRFVGDKKLNPSLATRGIRLSVKLSEQQGYCPYYRLDKQISTSEFITGELRANTKTTIKESLDFIYSNNIQIEN
ncbi:MAG: DUF6562 domain-containing protein [Marinifilaceae bacterium]